LLCSFFTADIPLIRKSHYEFILSSADLFRSWGHEVYIVSGLTYYDYVTHVSTRGKYKGRIFGFPSFKPSQCGFKRDSKLKALSSCDVGFFDYEDIGIAYDECRRFSSLSDFKRSILVESCVTESMAFDLCNDFGVLSPIYSSGFRDGCVLCPFSKPLEREEWFNDFPDALPLLLYLQDLVKSECPDRAPLPNYKYFI